jgi:hypothetical protein
MEGTLEDRYNIYRDCMRSMGASEEDIKTFDEWLDS